MTLANPNIDPVACAELMASPRWLDRVSISDTGCWLFTHCRRNGYAYVRVEGRTVGAHRVALIASLGRPMESFMQAGHVCHDRAVQEGSCSSSQSNPCDHRRCVNPDHLAEQTVQVNVLLSSGPAADHARRTHCPQGHELVGENLLPHQLKLGKRICLACNHQRSRDLNEAIKQARLMLGMTYPEFVDTYGRSLRTVRELLGAGRGVAA